MNESQQNLSLEAEIKGTLEAMLLRNKTGWTSHTGTTEIKRDLIALGKKKGFSVCASGFANDCETEWLWDLVWYRADPPNHLSEIGLILESEWSYALKDIVFDFEKLLVGKALFKVMVFQDFRDNVDELFSRLETGINCFQTGRSGEKYLLACYHNSKDRFEFKTVVA